ncbi:hypothetical protein H1P_830017 [Hyella patelloides LEGE 07179]|uniref:Uncharacterized protein n=1 Tax=Hyella patelloides LEGE 07179 TaxID=945734 RepID=A0A563W4I2_9CYAN|nr:hypothetical protein H1P_830017 [Hyella patelloides LEGE 07179]
MIIRLKSSKGVSRDANHGLTDGRATAKPSPLGKRPYHCLLLINDFLALMSLILYIPLFLRIFLN